MSMTRKEFLETLIAAREAWDALLDQISPAWMLVPGAAGRYTIKDIIAHINWYEKEMVSLMHERSMAHAAEIWPLPLDERNQAIYRQNQLRDLDEVLAESIQLHQQLLSEIKRLDDEDLLDPARFREMPPDWVPWEVIASNTYEHYNDHVPAIQAWMDNL